MRSERGEISLPGLLVAMSIFTVVLLATYAAFDTFNRNARDSQVRNEATDKARTGTDLMARQLRNLATPTALQPNAVALASAYDIVFETVAPTGTPPAANPQNIEFVRYCLDTANRRVYSMEMPPSTITTSTVAPSAAASCPGGGSWTNQRLVADNVVNRWNGADRPVFTFDSATNNLIHRVRVDFYIDPDPGKGPAEQQVTSGVDLRNQDRAPVASFVPTAAGNGVLVLDGTSSSDPDNDPLTYCWYDTSTSGTVGTCGTGSIGDSPYMRYSTTPGTHTIKLIVFDPSGLPNSTPPTTVTVT